ncbi:chondroitinase-B domain-containing protein [uncultured Polaribacter sp.]|uniref:chondroitinase-B domain-containing protein n=1 Tax=uncultured Polaribacter sp. TaxID=174711 RepID=UPI00261F7EB8|nr:chondroitinase-B domain-containing protein [uncultured Polaribacter sp.]
MRSRFQINIIIFLTFFIQLTKAQVVSSEAELNSAISSATAGSTIILTNGVWNNLELKINKNGTESNPIIIKAQSPNQVFIEGKSNIEMGGSYIVLEGFVFQNASNLEVSDDVIDPIITFRESGDSCNNCTVTNIKIDSYNGTTAQNEAVFKWILLYGSYNEVSHSSFIGKNGVGSIINDNRSDNLADYHKIHHNYFASREAVGDVNDLNDQDAIRIGTSSTSLSDSFTEIYNNFFHDWEGEIEIISNKSGKNKYYNNTFRNYSGTLTLRHGNGCEVYDNFFLAENRIFSGAIRIIGEDHKIYNNYISGISAVKENGSNTSTTGAINISNGRPNTELNGYYQVKNTTIVNNTFVDCDYGFRVGTSVKSDLTLAPENLILANNIMLNTSKNAFELQTNPIGTSINEGNINQNGNWDLTNGTNNNQTVTSGLLESGTDFYRLSSASAAIDAGIGSYTFLDNDLLGGTRDANFDAGAEEFGANGTNLPYKSADVGTKVGFLSAPTDHLSTSLETINFNIDAGDSNFDVISNVSWSISENVDWLTLNKTTGSNNETVQVSVLENNSGAERTATITVSEIDGDLSDTITITQSQEEFNSNNAVSITGISVTGVGTQDPNIPENTIDDDETTRWSANSSDGSAYLTYDLTCKRTITSVKIYFHKGSTRTSSFKIATSIDGTTFTDVTEVLTSSGSTTGFEEFTLSPFQEVQYVRILGYGNSEGSGWNSYEEVQIFGDGNCASLSTIDTDFISSEITIYPNPIKDNLLFIKSKTSEIGLVQVYNIQGKLLTEKQLNSLEGTMSINNYSSGIYFVKIKNTVKKIVIN